MYLWLAIVSFVLLNVILCLIGVCTCLKRRKRQEALYRYAVQVYGTGLAGGAASKLSNIHGLATSAYDSMLSFNNTTKPSSSCTKLYNKRSSSSSGCSSSDTYTQFKQSAERNSGSSMESTKPAKLPRYKLTFTKSDNRFDDKTNLSTRGARAVPMHGYYRGESISTSDTTSGSYEHGILKRNMRRHKPANHHTTGSATTDLDESGSFESDSCTYYNSKIIQL